MCVCMRNYIHTSLHQELIVNVRGHDFVEISYHTPSNCDVCNKTLPWSLVKGAQGTYECKRKEETFLFFDLCLKCIDVRTLAWPMDSIACIVWKNLYWFFVRFSVN